MHEQEIRVPIPVDVTDREALERADRLARSPSEAPEPQGKIIDLMEALRASLERTESAKESAAKLGPRKEAKRVEQPAKTARKASRR